MLAPQMKQWESEGRYLTTVLFQHKVFCKDVGSPAAPRERTLLVLHGFPESSFSFHKVVDGLAKLFDRVVLFDFPGYGLSDKPLAHYTYSLFEQADVALQVWKGLGVTGGHVLSHDMGDSVHTELIARHISGLLPASLSAGFKSFTFTNGNMVLDLAQLRLGQKVLLGPAGPLFSHLFANWCSFNVTVRSAQGNDRLPQEETEHMWANLKLQDGHRMSHLVIQYLKDRMRFEKTRWLPSLSLVKEPVHICWGDADAVSPVAVARHLKERVCPRARLTLMPGVGHFCQLSDPDVWLASVGTFYNEECGLSGATEAVA
jgi:pimeloyl-ACP methyl ester carboxylesterase